MLMEWHGLGRRAHEIRRCGRPTALRAQQLTSESSKDGSRLEAAQKPTDCIGTIMAFESQVQNSECAAQERAERGLSPRQDKQDRFDQKNSDFMKRGQCQRSVSAKFTVICVSTVTAFPFKR